ncbi:TetR/AcrR family transcriptional regulator [Paenibacillus antibioticophila]|uniref:TetR/AcrR family transcriptional regulator n=1 Tax=Paenibacillus antibioticophila TaxID=1274374 RepID=UPI0005C97D71|nr:TetR/AcrR family transcriptional regulator [Paenibacillus antibioticophila]
MPKIVDYAAERARIAEAAWRLIQKEGMERVSVRKVAKEAGVSAGALQHYFRSQDELLGFAMRLVIERVEQRFDAVNDQLDEVSVSGAKSLLFGLLPLDQERKIEAEVWMSLCVKALHHDGLFSISQSVHKAMQELMVLLLQQLAAERLLKRGLDLASEAVKLHLLLDGLTIQHMMQPAVMTPEQMQKIMNQHLDELISRTDD